MAILSDVLDPNAAARLKVRESELIDLNDYPRIRKDIFDNVLKTVKGSFPTENEKYRLTVENIGYSSPERYTKKEQRDALLNNETFSRKLVGNLRVYDKETGKLVSSSGKKTIMNVPYLTDTGTFIRNGTEYVINKQFRLVPSIYTRVTADGLYESQFNIKPRTGVPFRIYMEPDTSLFFIRSGGRKIPLFPVLSQMGVPEENIKKAWGPQIYSANERQRISPYAIRWIKEVAAKGESYQEKEGADKPILDQDPVKTHLNRYFENMELDPEATQSTVGVPYKNVNQAALLTATGKILKLAKGEAEADDRDSLAYQTVYDFNDFITDKISHDQNGVLKQLMWKITNRQGDLSRVPSGVMDKHLSHLFNVSGVGTVVEEISPMDMFGQNRKVTRLGEGALPSVESAPDDARNVQPSYLGYVDPIRSVESLRVGLDNFFARNVRKGPNNMIYTKFLSSETNAPVWVDARTAASSIIGFPEAIGSKDKYVPALYKAKGIYYTPRKDVQYYLMSGDDAFSTEAESVPLKSGVKGMRLLMGCLAPTTKLLIKRINNIFWYGSVAEYVWEAGDKTHTVDNDGHIYWQEIYGVRKNTTPLDSRKIWLKSGRMVHTTDNHNWLTLDASGKLQKIRADMLKEGDSIPRDSNVDCAPILYSLVIPGRNRWKTYEEKTIPLNFEWGWVFGLYLAEGSIGMREMPDGGFTPAYIDFAAEQETIRNRLQQLFEGVGVHARLGKHSVVVAWTSFAEVVEDWFSHGSFDKKLTGRVFSCSEDFRKGLVAGYLDGDGTVALRRNHARVKGGSRSEELIDGLMLVLSSLNIDTTKRIDTVVNSPFYLFEVRKQDVSKLPALIHPLKKERLEAEPEWTGKKSYNWIPLYDALQQKVLLVSGRKEQFRHKIYVNQCTKELLSTRLSVEDCCWIGSKVLWDRVEKVEETDVLNVSYDLDLGDKPLSVGLGIFVHNSKYLSHALPLKYREIPYVQTLGANGKSFTENMGKYMGAIHADKPGVVTRVGKDSIWVRYDDGTTDAIDIYNQYPLARKTNLNNTPIVKAGDKIKKNQVVAISNFTDEKGHAAPGINLRVAYMNYKGHNYEDAIVISKTASTKLTSDLMFQHALDEDEGVKVGLNKFRTLFPGKFSPEQLKKITPQGFVEEGQILEYGDPIILATQDKIPSLAAMGRRKIIDQSVTWDKETPGKVVHVARTKDGITVYTVCETPTQVADKLAVPFGGKGVIAKIVNDEDMPRDKDGKPVDVIFSPLSIASRTNPAQLLAAALGKVSEKTGKKYVLTGFMTEDMTEFTKNELKQAGLDPSGREDIYDPVDQKTIPRVFIGNIYTYKLQQTAESKSKARSIGEYSQDEEPSRGGSTGSKHFGDMEYGALMSHGACFLPGTDILTKTGRTKIEKIVGFRKNYEVLCKASDGMLEYKPVIDWFVRTVPRDSFITVHTTARAGGIQGGRKPIKCTKGHEFYTERGIVKANDLITGDVVYTPGTILTSIQEQLIMGTLMGDGHASTRHHSWRLQEAHSISQLEYLQFKYQMLKNICQTTPKISKRSARTDAFKGSKDQARFITRAHYQIGKIAKTFYTPKKTVPKDIVSKMGLFGLAIWFCDDGSVSSSEGITRAFRLHTCSFSKEEVLQLVEDLKKFTKLESWVMFMQNGKYPIIQLQKGGREGNDLQKFVDMLIPYIPECMRYKLGSLCAKETKLGVAWENLVVPEGLYAEPCEVINTSPFILSTYQKSIVYNITVQDYHNYVANGVIVGNSEVIKDTKLIKGQKNTDFWRQLKLGQTPVMPTTPFVYEKFKDMIRSGGVTLTEGKDSDNIFSMTDEDARKLTGNRKIDNSSTFSAISLKPIAGGLFDPEATGSLLDGNRFAYIALPEPLLNPVMESPVRALLGITQKEFSDIVSGRRKVEGKVSGEALKLLLDQIDLKKLIKTSIEDIRSGSPSKRDRAIKTAGYATAMLKAKVNPSDFMMTRIPVLPPKYRPISRQGALTMVADMNYMYKELMSSLDDFNDTKDLPELIQQDARQKVYDNYKSLVGITDPTKAELKSKQIGGILQQLFGSGSPKTSFVQRKVLGTNIDISGLAVVTPNPSLRLNEVGLPEKKAWELYEPFVIRELVLKGVPATAAATAVQDRTKMAYRVLQDVVKQRPVMINRAPTLHKYSIMAMWPILTKGNTLQVSPSLVAPLNMDFDGDSILTSTAIELNLRKLEEALANSGTDTILSSVEDTKCTLQTYKGDSFMLPKEAQVAAVNATVRIEDIPVLPETKVDKGNGVTEWNVPEGIKIFAIDRETGKQALAPITKFSVHENCKLYDVSIGVASKKVITVSEDHSMVVYDTETEKIELCAPLGAIGKLVPCSKELFDPDHESVRRVTLDGERNGKDIDYGFDLSYDIGFLFGMLIGDGWVDSQNHTCCSIFNDVLRDIFETVVTKLGGNPTRTEHERINLSGKMTTSKRVNCNLPTKMSVCIKAAIGSGAINKTIPWQCLSGPKAHLIGLFCGLMNTDGTLSSVMGQRNGKQGWKHIVKFDTISPYLRDTFTYLCLRLGMQTTVTAYKSTSFGTQAYAICISLPDFVKFYKEYKNQLVFYSENKQKAADNILETLVLDSSAAIRMDAVPYPSKWHKTLNKLNGKTQSLVVPNTVLYTLKNNGYMSRDIAVRLVNLLKETDQSEFSTDELQGLLRWASIVENEQITWKPVTSIKENGIKTCYDITVPGVFTFATSSGVFVQDTASFTVPVGAKAVREAITKMMPDTNLLSVRTSQPNYLPRQEYSQGLYYSTKEPERKPPVIFATKEEALRAFKLGKISVDDPIVIK